MFRISRLQQLLQQVPRGVFARSVKATQADRHCKGFDSWSHLVGMVYAQFAEVRGLRQLEAGFNAQYTHPYHLGCGPIRRSTLAEANGRRPTEPFMALACALMAQWKGQDATRREAGELLQLLDSTSITLKGRGFNDWTESGRTRNTQGLKLHVLYDMGAQVPRWLSFSKPNVNDIERARDLPLEAGTVYVFDKGYCDYNWWARIDAAGAQFVTRFKRNAGLRQVESRPIPEAARATILTDEIVRFAHARPRGGHRNHYTAALRRITVVREGHPPLVLATNDLHSEATVIAQHYKDRWQVELFFKWIKQHLRIRSFFGRSRNAVLIQILCALIAYLLLALHKQATASADTLWQLFGQLRATLFQRPTLEAEQYRKRQERRREFERLQPGLFQ